MKPTLFQPEVQRLQRGRLRADGRVREDKILKKKKFWSQAAHVQSLFHGFKDEIYIKQKKRNNN